MDSTFKSITPVLPSSDLLRDIEWYEKMTGLKAVFSNEGYAVLNRENLFIHLQWHAGSNDDPLNGGSVIRILVDEIEPVFDEFVKRGTVKEDKLNLQTAWNTKEFGFFDLNSNAIFIMEDLN